jgi:hypothetical protein
MARESRFGVTFAQDGATVTLQSGAIDPEVIGISNMPSHAREHCFRNGLKSFILDAVAGATKAGWSDDQCLRYMSRKARAIVAGQLRLSESNADFMHLVSAIMAIKQWDGSRRGEMEAKLLQWPAEKRKLAESTYAKEIAEARLAYVTAQMDGAEPQATGLLDEL